MHLAAIRRMVRAGYDHVYVHQIGPRQDDFMRFYQREVFPELQTGPARLAPLGAGPPAR